MCWEIELLGKYLKGEPLEIVVDHGRAVAELALGICRRLCLTEEECRFVESAALLHDIGVCGINAPKLGLYGDHPYITHGIIGRKILEEENLPLHALVCERHIGVGLTVADIINQDLPLPHRDMTPQSLSEEIICYSDLFYSKKPGNIKHRKPEQRVREKLASFGEGKIQIFDSWLLRFETERLLNT